MDFAKKYNLDLVAGEDYTIKENHRFARKMDYGIIVIGRTVYCSKELAEVPKHEYLHIAQYKKYGSLPVLLHYWYYFTINFLRMWNFKKAFMQVPFEREAREFEKLEIAEIGERHDNLSEI